MKGSLKMRAIYFDMDGTIADFYGVENWLDSLHNEYTKPYREAKPLLNMRQLARELNRLQKLGYIIGIVSWLSKNGTSEYNLRVEATKRKWLERHLSSVEWDEIHIIEYGTPKYEVVEHPMGILFDDEEHNRKEWHKQEGFAFNVEHILEILKGLI